MPKCEICGQPYNDGGDGWDGLCPSCADVVSAYMDKHHVNRDKAMDAVREQIERGEYPHT